MCIRDCPYACKPKRFLTDPLAQREDFGVNVRRPVINAVAGQADGIRVDRACIVVGISDNIVTAIVAIVDGYATRGHNLVAQHSARRDAASAADIFTDKGISTTAQGVGRIGVADIREQATNCHDRRTKR